jgi:hypothetical protein
VTGVQEFKYISVNVDKVIKTETEQGTRKSLAGADNKGSDNVEDATLLGIKLPGPG